MARGGKRDTEHPFAPAELERWKRRYGRSAVEAMLTKWDTEAVDKASDALLASLVDGSAFDRAFLKADLDRRRSEAAMVAHEVEIFGHAAALMQQTAAMRAALGPKLASPGGAEGLQALNGTLDSAANLVKALADKNATMGSGVPGTTRPSPSGSGGLGVADSPTAFAKPPAAGGDGGLGVADSPTAFAKPPTGGGDGKPPCYEAYKRRIAELGRQKEQMGDDLIWWLQWGDALKDLTLCAGPEAVKLLLEMLAAAKGKDD